MMYRNFREYGKTSQNHELLRCWLRGETGHESLRTWLSAMYA